MSSLRERLMAVAGAPPKAERPQPPPREEPFFCREHIEPLGGGSLAYGEVLVTWLVTMFKKFKLDTQETLGFGPVDLPEL